MDQKLKNNFHPHEYDTIEGKVESIEHYDSIYSKIVINGLYYKVTNELIAEAGIKKGGHLMGGLDFDLDPNINRIIFIILHPNIQIERKKTIINCSAGPLGCIPRLNLKREAKKIRNRDWYEISVTIPADEFDERSRTVCASKNYNLDGIGEGAKRKYPAKVLIRAQDLIKLRREVQSSYGAIHVGAIKKCPTLNQNYLELEYPKDLDIQLI